jgi:hypothetical protein
MLPCAYRFARIQTLSNPGTSLSITSSSPVRPSARPASAVDPPQPILKSWFTDCLPRIGTIDLRAGADTAGGAVGTARALPKIPQEPQQKQNEDELSGIEECLRPEHPAGGSRQRPRAGLAVRALAGPGRGASVFDDMSANTHASAA